MYTLYTIPGSCSTGIHALLNALGQPVTIINRDTVENYSSMVPTNQVPALKDGDKLLTEGAAIVQYLLDKHGVNLSSFTSTTLVETAPNRATTERFRQWLMFCYATLHPAYSKLFTVLREMDDSDTKTTFDKVLANKVELLWGIVDKQLDGKHYLMGNTVSVMDYLITIYANWGNLFPHVSIKLGKNVIRLVEDIVQRPEFKLALEKEGVNHVIPSGSY